MKGVLPMHLSSKHNKEVVLCGFVDFRKSFDRVPPRNYGKDWKGFKATYHLYGKELAR